MWVTAWGVTHGDFDGDGDPDLFFAADLGDQRLLLNDGQGHFVDAPPGSLPTIHAPRGRLPCPGDFDGDGNLDVFVPSADQDLLLLGDGAGGLVDATPLLLGEEHGPGHSAAPVDLDLDGHLDLVVAGGSGRLRILRNDGTGRLFDYSSSFPGNSEQADAAGVAVGDVDGDGDLDLFVSRAHWQLPWLLLSWGPESPSDVDSDGVPDAADGCPETPDPLQGNTDIHHFACEGPADCAALTGCDLAVRDAESAYLICAAVEGSWAQARDFCQGLGADLAVVEDATENDFLVAHGASNHWLGLDDLEVEGAFVWVDGQPLSFANWQPGEPNNSGGIEHCAHTRVEGTWNDLACDAPRLVLCEDAPLRLPPDPGDACDVCPFVWDPAQADSDADGTGDACAP